MMYVQDVDVTFLWEEVYNRLFKGAPNAPDWKDAPRDVRNLVKKLCSTVLKCAEDQW